MSLQSSAFFTLRWSNWPLALAAAVVLIPLAAATLPATVAFWIAGIAVALVALTLVVRAAGRHTGGLLVAPALGVLFVMNIFPLLWSFGLSFFSYRANRMAPPRFAGLDYYERVMSDPTVWDRLHTTAIIVVLTVTAQMVVGFLLALLFAREFPLRRYLLILVLTPMMLSYVAMGAFFRYYYEPTFGLLSQMVLLLTGERFVQQRVGLHHLCLRARSREDVDRCAARLKEMNATIVRGPMEGPWAPGYYYVLFEDPDGIRLEVNFVPGAGLLAEGAQFNPSSGHV